MYNEELFLTLAIVIGALFLITLILREFSVWYFKINTRVKQNNKQIELLKRIAKAQGVDISDIEKQEQEEKKKAEEGII